MKKAWYELSPAFYAWLAHNAVPYDSLKATSSCDKFAKVRYEDFARCIMSVTGRKVKRVKPPLISITKILIVLTRVRAPR